MKKNKTEDPLSLLAELASLLDSSEFINGTSKIQKDAIRSAADQLRVALEKYFEPLSPPALVCYVAGASAQVALSKQESPLAPLLSSIGLAAQTDSPSHTLMLIVSYLARDLLAGERIE